MAEPRFPRPMGPLAEDATGTESGTTPRTPQPCDRFAEQPAVPGADPGLEQCGDRQPQARVFVYGSLRRGQRNHGLLRFARAEGEGSLAGAVLHDLGPFPMAVPGDGMVHGEVFALPATQLGALDRFEGVPRLYQRHRRRLVDGRWVWVYLGRAQQVRHSPRLPAGRWPAAGAGPGAATGVQARALLALAPLLLATLPAAASFDNQAACAAWRSSHGTARILLGNQIGAENRLSKNHRLQESPPEAPIALYSVIDLRRICDERR